MKVTSHKSQVTSSAPPALFIGRFQPFHLGHLHAIEKILEKEDSLIIAIGSTQYHFQPENPWTTSERIQMIQSALKEKKIDPSRYCIMPVVNIEDYKNWPNHVDNTLPPYETVYSGSPLTRRLYEEQKKHPIKNIPIYKNISATIVRQHMLKDKNWEQLIPKTVAALLRQWNSVERIKEIQI